MSKAAYVINGVSYERLSTKGACALLRYTRPNGAGAVEFWYDAAMKRRVSLRDGAFVPAKGSVPGQKRVAAAAPAAGAEPSLFEELRPITLGQIADAVTRPEVLAEIKQGLAHLDNAVTLLIQATLSVNAMRKIAEAASRMADNTYFRMITSRVASRQKP